LNSSICLKRSGVKKLRMLLATGPRRLGELELMPMAGLFAPSERGAFRGGFGSAVLVASPLSPGGGLARERSTTILGATVVTGESPIARASHSVIPSALSILPSGERRKCRRPLTRLLKTGM